LVCALLTYSPLFASLTATAVKALFKKKDAPSVNLQAFLHQLVRGSPGEASLPAAGKKIASNLIALAA
jgi:hypothetical protein